ncbi:MAG: hypothetical protein IJ494_04635 [Bacteroides sp.]|nr:hypothetical protein [Bacteroides sp.]
MKTTMENATLDWIVMLCDSFDSKEDFLQQLQSFILKVVVDSSERMDWNSIYLSLAKFMQLIGVKVELLSLVCALLKDMPSVQAGQVGDDFHESAQRKEQLLDTRLWVTYLFCWKKLEEQEEKQRLCISFPELRQKEKTCGRGRKVVHHFYKGMSDIQLYKVLKEQYQRLYHTSIEESASVSSERTVTFLVCFLIGLYRYDFDKIWGNISSYVRFLQQRYASEHLPCLRTFQRRVKLYEDYRNHRKKFSKRTLCKFQAWERLIEDIHKHLSAEEDISSGF